MSSYQIQDQIQDSVQKKNREECNTSGVIYLIFHILVLFCALVLTLRCGYLDDQLGFLRLLLALFCPYLAILIIIVEKKGHFC